MAKAKPDYEVINEFNVMANQLVEKYPVVFFGVEVDKIRCVKITNKERQDKEGKPNKLWAMEAVKMPIRLDCPYAWYISIFHNDWDVMDTSHKLLLIAEILHGIPKDEEGKVVSCDIKGYGTMFRTFKTIDYLDSPDVPNLLKDDIEWKTSRH